MDLVAWREAHIGSLPKAPGKTRETQAIPRLLAVFGAFLIGVGCHSNEQTPADVRSRYAAFQAEAATAPISARKRICEPTVTCGTWSRCLWLEIDHLEPTYEVYRIAGSDTGGQGSHFWRVHDCYPSDAGPGGCARYCGPNGACVDGFMSDADCSASRPPSPAPYVCEVRNGACVERQ